MFFSLPVVPPPPSPSKTGGLAQCTRDLSQRSCDQCLQDLTGSLSSGKIGGQVDSVSCVLRFETYIFFSQSAFPPPPSPSKIGEGDDLLRFSTLISPKNNLVTQSA